VLQEIRRAHQHLGRSRHRAAQRIEQGLQLRQQHQLEKQHHAAGDHHHEDRIGHRRQQLPLQLLPLGQMVDQPLERFIERTGRLARLNQVDGRSVEDFWECRHRARQRRAFAQLLPESTAQPLEARIADPH